MDRKTKETHVDKTSGIERRAEYRYDARTGRKQMEINWIGEQDAAEPHFVYDRFWKNAGSD